MSKKTTTKIKKDTPETRISSSVLMLCSVMVISSDEQKTKKERASYSKTTSHRHIDGKINEPHNTMGPRLRADQTSYRVQVCERDEQTPRRTQYCMQTLYTKDVTRPTNVGQSSAELSFTR
nr:MAG: hypothetical protein [Apis mellifera filamentous virus]